MSITRTLAAVMLVLFGANLAFGQGIIIDRRPDMPVRGSYDVRKISVDATIRDQVAEVQVSQTFHNPGSGLLEAEYLFPLPDDGAVQSFTLMVDGKELGGKLLPRDEARRIYEAIVRTKRDPALLEYSGLGVLKTSVFPIPSGAERTVTLRYTQLCRRDREVVEFAYPLATCKFSGKPVEKVTVDVRIASSDPIKNVYCPSHDIAVNRSGATQADAHLTQLSAAATADFRLLYSLDKAAVGATVLSWRPNAGEDGYYLVLASPGFTAPDRKPQPKTVVLVLDKSGSMAGKKIEQAREAAKFVIANLNDGDLFNIIDFDDRVDPFKPELQRYGKESAAEARSFIENIREGGSTNIDGALSTAFNMLRDDGRPNYLLFMTDGLPTAGDQNEMSIAAHAKSMNKVNVRLIAFGVGYDVNARLLDRLSHGNGGVSEYVKPEENIEATVARFYGRITAPVLSHITMELADTRINRTYPKDMPDLFEGAQLVAVGRYATSGKTELKISGKVGDTLSTFTSPVVLAAPGEGDRYAFVEKLWAVRRVGDLIDQIDLHGSNSELVAKLVQLSKKYGILTPYTSFLADENVKLGDAAANHARVTGELKQLAEVDGKAGSAQRSYKNSLQYDQAPAAATPAPMRINAAGDKSAALTVRNIGNKTFYWKDNRWIDSAVTDKQEHDAPVIHQYSDEYFKIVEKLPAAQNQYLATDKDITVEIEGKVYQVKR